MKVELCVMYYNESVEANFLVIEVECTEEQFAVGEHREIAREKAVNFGLAEPLPIFDQYEPAFKVITMLRLSNDETVKNFLEEINYSLKAGKNCGNCGGPNRTVENNTFCPVCDHKEDFMPQYQWCINKMSEVKFEENTGNAEYVLEDLRCPFVGPHNAVLTDKEILEHPEGIPFRLLNGDDEVDATGVFLGSQEYILAPLDDYGNPAMGSITLQIANGDEWESVN